jgi:hypothetical protein
MRRYGMILAFFLLRYFGGLGGTEHESTTRQIMAPGLICGFRARTNFRSVPSRKACFPKRFCANVNC